MRDYHEPLEEEKCPSRLPICSVLVPWRPVAYEVRQEPFAQSNAVEKRRIRQKGAGQVLGCLFSSNKHTHTHFQLIFGASALLWPIHSFCLSGSCQVKHSHLTDVDTTDMSAAWSQSSKVVQRPEKAFVKTLRIHNYSYT